MAKALIIAEKPSVAADIARALGGFTRQGEHFEHESFVLSSAVGHLVEIAAPEDFEVKRGKWSFANLPVIPPHFDLRPIARNEERLKMLAKLIKRKDVDLLINACDAGREGELIFQQIAQFAKARQPVRRLWLQSMTPAAIRQGFAALQDDKVELSAAARCRSEADWLVGINGTRAMTAFNSRDGGFFLTTVGRVQTPTLAIVVGREEQIRRFVARPYWEVRAQFGAQAGPYDGKWFDPEFRKTEGDEHARAERIWDLAQAQAIVAGCQGQAGTVVDESRPSSQASPALFDLTTLQREANSRFGFSAKTTLSIAQALYEKHKVLTYPRTDSRHLPEDYLATVAEVMQAMQTVEPSGSAASAAATLAPFAQQALAQGWIKPNKRIFDNAKVSDHFAIIPTTQHARTLSDAEQKIYDLVARRFLAVFFPPAEYLVTTRTTSVGAQRFRTNGKILRAPGWLAIYGREAQEDDASLVMVKAHEQVGVVQIEAHAMHTQPPPRFNEGTLLSAMENAGAQVDDEVLSAAMGDKGLGTPATRAAIIEGLLDEKYLLREGRDLQPTAKAFQLLTLLRGLGVQELTLPELTGQWEHKLKLIEQGKLAREAFMREIGAMTQRIVERAKSYESDTVPGDYATLQAPCPRCGGVVRENYRRFACSACEFSISKNPGSRSFEIPEVEQLLRERVLGPLQGFRSKIGRPFAAILKITPECKLEFDFGGSDRAEESGAEAEDFSSQTALGACPKCQARVFEKGLYYVCEQSVGATRSCDFRTGKIILQQEISTEQMGKLLANGRTDLLTNFVSARTRRKFKAFLVRDAEGKIGFEFEPRPAKAAAGTPREGARTTAAKGAAKSTAKSAAPAESAAPPKPSPATKPRRTRAKADAKP